MSENKLMEAAQEAIREAALRPDTLNVINNAIQQGKEANKENERLLKRVDELHDEVARLHNIENERNAARKELEDSRNLQRDMAIELAAANAKAGTVYSCFELVFRNAQVHESVTRSVPVPVTNGDQNYTNTHVEAHVQTENVTREEK
jgi:hypothetical protein